MQYESASYGESTTQQSRKVLPIFNWKEIFEVIIVYFYQFPSDDEIYCENFTLFSFIIHKHDRPFSSPFISETIPPRLISR